MTSFSDPQLLISAAVAATVGAGWVALRAKAVKTALLGSLMDQETRAALAESKLVGAEHEVVRLEASIQALREARQDTETIREHLRSQFAEDAQKVLGNTSEQFLKLADTRLQQRELVMAEQLDKRQVSIDKTLEPLQKELGKMQDLARSLDLKRENAMGSLTEHLTKLDQATGALRQQSQALTDTLRGNVRVRGRWGEQTLRRLAELGGLVEQCDFVEQTGTGEARPDMIVRLPDDGQLPVDAKAPLEHFLEASESKDPDRQLALLQAHAGAVRNHVRVLAKRDYPSKLDLRLGMTVMFLPSDAMLSAALEQLPELFEEAQRSRVLLATPMTLLAMLKTIAVLWNQHQMVENSARIAKVAGELYDRIAVFQEHMSKVGKGLQSASEAYQAAATSYASRIVPSGRRLQELGGVSGPRREVSDLPEVVAPQVAVVISGEHGDAVR